MKFPLKFLLPIKIILYVMLTVSVASIVFCVLTLADVYTFLNLSIGQVKLFLPTAILTILFAIALLTIHYEVDDSHLRIKLLFFDLLSGRIRIENLLNIVYTNGEMYVSYIWKGPDPVIANVMIHPKKFNQLKDLLMSKNKNIVFYEDNDETVDSQQ